MRSRTMSETTGRVALASGLAVILTLLLLGLQAAKPARAASTFTVNSTGDGNDLDFPGGTFDGSSNGKCDVSSATVGDQCTLRAAIQTANKFPGADAIHFGIPTTSPACVPATGVCKITPGTRLPLITRPLTIDGYTQSGATENTLTQLGQTNASPKIELDGFTDFAGLVVVGSDASNTVIRGLVINGFNFGILFSGGKGHNVEGNFIGTDPEGDSDLGNSLSGVVLSNADGSTVGGASPEARNLISGNGSSGDSAGVWVRDGATGNRIQGNLIGTDKTGTAPLGNTGNGVFLDDASNNTVGDADPSDGPTNAANTIAFNAFVGVDVEGATAGNRILSNSIFSNTGPGIDLGPDGVTNNDPKDPDAGANHLQNFPIITSAFDLPSGTGINGTLDSISSTRKKKSTFTVQFFSNPAADPSEGKTSLGEVRVTTNRQGKVSFGFFTNAVSEGDFITATVTRNSTGDTSEFSEARIVQGPVIGP